MNINSLLIKSLKPSSHSFNHQIVRWWKPRKPFWLGIAKSKMFVIPGPRVIRPPEEKEDYNRLRAHYEVHYESLLKFIKVDNPRADIFVENLKGDEVKMSPVLEEMVSMSLKNNENWNAESAKLRESRTKENLEKEMERAIQEIDEFEEKKMRQMEWIEEIVKQEKELSKNFVTHENLDEMVEKCLDSVVCYDFAIDLQGTMYKGRESLPSPFNQSEKAVSSAAEGV